MLTLRGHLLHSPSASSGRSQGCVGGTFQWLNPGGVPVHVGDISQWRALGFCSSFLRADCTKGLALLFSSLQSEAFGLGAFYEETTRELDARRAKVLARSPEEAEGPAEDTSGIVKMAIKFDR